jgi:glycosyltransferase involved in cell wall biosynthesis
MKIAYVTTYDSSDIEAWSGLGHHIRTSLCRSGFDIHPVDKLSETGGVLSAAKRFYYATLAMKTFRRDREPSLLRSYALQVEKALESVDCDVVFSPGTVPIAYVKTDKPIVFWTDSTFAGMVDFYPDFTNLCDASIRRGHQMEQAALNQCSLAIYSSEWAASTALRHYAVDPRKVKIVPFGANTDGLQRTDDGVRTLAAKSRDVCRLLFVGADWGRKRGEFALAIADLLVRQGIRTELNIVGCVPPHSTPRYVKVHGYVSKRTSHGRETLRRLFSECHFLLHPSRAECFGLVLAEAGSFGVPCVATNVGGTSSVVTDGINGLLFAVDESAAAYCSHIQRLFGSTSEYERLALSSFKEYCERLNWEVAGQRVRELIEEAVEGRRGTASSRALGERRREVVESEAMG